MDDIVFGEIIEGQFYKDRPAAYALLINDKNEIAIIKTPRGYFLPGGGIEEGETHSRCLEREMLEETGLGVDVGDYVGSATLYGFAPRKKAYLRMIGYFYKVKLNGIQTEKVEEDHELVWMDISKAHNALLLEHQSWAVKMMAEDTNI